MGKLTLTWLSFRGFFNASSGTPGESLIIGYSRSVGAIHETRCKELEPRLRLYQPNESAVAEHSIESDHRIEFHDTEVPAETSAYAGRLIKE